MRDIRGTELYRRTTARFSSFLQPGTGQICDAAEVHASADGKRAVFAGAFLDKLEGAPSTRICATDLGTGDTRILTLGPNADRSPQFSPHGRLIAFLSDRRTPGNFQLYLLDPATGTARLTPSVEGWVEYLQWSPDGTRILLGVAGHGADIAGGQGAIASATRGETLPSWMPTVETGDETYRWRRLWIYELAADSAQPVAVSGPPGFNVWEAAWCGNDAVVAVASARPSEGSWYSAGLLRIDITTGTTRTLFTPSAQIGWLSASPCGKHVAIVEALCSDRWIVAGDLCVIDTNTGSTHNIDTRGIDITCTEWRSDRKLLLAGHRGFQSVVALYDASSQSAEEIWSSEELTSGGPYIRVSGIGESGDCVLIGESCTRAPELAVIRSRRYTPVKSFVTGHSEDIGAAVSIERLTWKARDGLDIQGWLLSPTTSAPHPLIMTLHGGPVWHWHPAWLGRGGPALSLLESGYAILFPNPRGSSGRGQAFARQVLGDMAGADARDCLSGIDFLIAQGIVDPSRLGVMGGSYGGYLTSWLVSQDPRFAAAISVAPVTNRVSQHLTCAHPEFVALFMQDAYNNPTGKYFARSPIMHAHKVKTPTLNICGALDRCTPPQEAVQFHNALLQNGVPSELVIYPEEGHGVRRLPASIDYVSRVVEWFDRHLL
jgi:dipeptidyl aminopeptidase/acylaminoacyl peptidase